MLKLKAVLAQIGDAAAKLITNRLSQHNAPGEIRTHIELSGDELHVHANSEARPDTLTTRNNLASYRGEGGDIAGAVTEFAALLADRTRVLGADHPATLDVRGNLASCRGESGDVAGAVTEFAALLAEQQRVLGADHPATLDVRGNLASCRGESGTSPGR